jgi:uncharacterized SAM-binding protein YcdF (DUF218 family)
VHWEMWSVSKNLELLCYPIGAIWLLLLVGAFSFLIKRKLSAGVLMLGIAAIITVIGSTPLPAAALASLEKPYANQNLAAVSGCDAIVVLGGALGYSPNDIFSADFGNALDRFVTGVELARRNERAALVIAGPYIGREGGAAALGTEGALLGRLARHWKLVGTNIVALPHCSNTHDEAIHTSQLVAERKWTRVALVTSAWHLRRSEAVFRKAGVNVVPIACDFRGQASLQSGTRAIVPQLNGFELLNLFLHEKIGWRVYSWRGWI